MGAFPQILSRVSTTLESHPRRCGGFGLDELAHQQALRCAKVARTSHMQRLFVATPRRKRGTLTWKDSDERSSKIHGATNARNCGIWRSLAFVATKAFSRSDNVSVCSSNTWSNQGSFANWTVTGHTSSLLFHPVSSHHSLNSFNRMFDRSPEK